MSCAPLTCCSIGAATDCATILALAPGNVAVTVTCGGTTCGYCAIGSASAASAARERNDQRNDRREDRTSDKEIEHAYLAPLYVAGAGAFASSFLAGPPFASAALAASPAFAASGAAPVLASGPPAIGLTGAPGRAFCIPSTITVSPSVTPLSTTQLLPSRMVAAISRYGPCLRRRPRKWKPAFSQVPGRPAVESEMLSTAPMTGI